jgi:5-methyltetrahydrofolate--homocysteine methyltransferase
MSENEKIISEFTEYLLGERSGDPVVWVRSVLNAGLPPLDFFNNIFNPTMTIIGAKFSRLDIFLPELMDAAETAKRIIEQVIDPMFIEQKSSSKTSRGKILICTVQGDLHDIGKNMVSIMLQVNGFEVIDLGTNVNTRTILDRAIEEKVDIVGLSSLMTTSMSYMKEVVDLRDGFGHKDKFAIIIGGAPITAEFATMIGADGFGKDAFEAVERCMALISRVKS